MSDSIPLVPGKAPFHYGLFFNAVKYLLGEPVHKQNSGFDGYYDYFWEFHDKESRKKINDAFNGIRDMMKCFNLQFPESRCDIAKWDIAPDADREYLRITIQHEVKKKET